MSGKGNLSKIVVPIEENSRKEERRRSNLWGQPIIDSVHNPSLLSQMAKKAHRMGKFITDNPT